VVKSVHVTRDVVFNEQAQWDWGTGSDSSKAGDNDDVFTVEYSVMTQAPLVVEDTGEAPRAAAVVSGDEQTPPPSPHAGGAPGAEVVEFASPPGENGDNLDANYDKDDPLQYQRIDSILGPASPVGFVPRVLVAEELLVVF
jgi:hypothetical protein